MKDYKNLSDKKLNKQIEKINNKINTLSDLIWLALIVGLICIAATVVTGLIGVSNVAKACGVVAAIQSINICLFFGLNYILINKESKLVVERHYRHQQKEFEEEKAKIQEELKEKVIEIRHQFEEETTSQKQSENTKENSCDDEFKID